MKDISIILPSIRPNGLYNCIDRICTYVGDKIDYEIVLITDIPRHRCTETQFFDVDDLPNIFNNLKVVKEDRKGGIHKAIKRGVSISDGKYIMSIADYHRIESNCIENIVEFMRKHDNELIITNPKYHHYFGTDPECYVWNFYYARTPCIKKENLDKIGGEFYSTEFVSSYGDADLSLRVLEKEGRVCMCPDAWIYHSTKWEIIRSCDDKDVANDDSIFNKKWEKRHMSVPGNLNEIEMYNNATFVDYRSRQNILKIQSKIQSKDAQ